MLVSLFGRRLGSAAGGGVEMGVEVGVGVCGSSGGSAGSGRGHGDGFPEDGVGVDGCCAAGVFAAVSVDEVRVGDVQCGFIGGET